MEYNEIISRPRWGRSMNLETTLQSENPKAAKAIIDQLKKAYSFETMKNSDK